MSLKGWFLQQGPASLKKAGVDELFATVTKAGKDKAGLDVTPKVASQVGSTKTITSASYSESTGLWTITCAGHGARADMFIRFASGANDGIETPIVSVPTANTFTVYGGQSHLSTLAGTETFDLYQLQSQTDSNAPINVLVTAAAKAPLAYGYIDAEDDNIGAAYVEVIADSGATEIQRAHIFYGNGNPLLLAFGGAGSEVDKLIIPPGGLGEIEISIPANTRLSVKQLVAADPDVTEGLLAINLLG
jgi:hypothetical protein